MADCLIDALKESLRQMGGEFKPNRLAYLSLTSKNETPLCGALAGLLHEKLAHDPELTVRREYRSNALPKRPFDIAVLQDSKAVLLIEAKAAMAFNPILTRTRVYPSKEVQADADKLRQIEEVVKRYTLAFFTIYDSRPNDEHHAAITYIDGIVSHVKRHKNPKDSFFKEGLPRFREAMDYRCPEACGEIPAGRAFGVNVSVWYELRAV